MKKTIYLWSVFVVVVSTPLLARSGEISPEDRLRSEYPAVLAQMQEFTGQLHVTGSLTVTSMVGTPRQKDRVYKLRYYAASGRMRLDRVMDSIARKGGEDSSVSEMASVMTPEKSFQVRRSTGDSPFLLSYFGVGQEGIFHTRGEIMEGQRIVESPFRMVWITVADVLDRSRFKIDSITASGTSGRQTFRIDFHRVEAPARHPNQRLNTSAVPIPASGWFIVSPSNGWRMDKYSITYDNGQKLTSTIEYREPQHGMQIPKNFIMEGEKNKARALFRFAFEDYTHTSTGDHDFTLDAFGLHGAESMGRPYSSNYVAYLLCGVGIVSLICAAFLSYLSGVRSRSAQVAPPSRPPASGR